MAGKRLHPQSPVRGWDFSPQRGAEILFPVGQGGRCKVQSFKNTVCSGAQEACLEWGESLWALSSPSWIFMTGEETGVKRKWLLPLRSVSSRVTSPTCQLPCWLELWGTHPRMRKRENHMGGKIVVQLLSRVQLFATPWTQSIPGFPVLHYLPEFARTHVHWVDDAI